MPQETATTTRCTRIAPFFTETSATSATWLPKEEWQAMPRATPAGSFVPQPAFSAASVRAPPERVLGAGRSACRKASGSLPAAAASSSTKHSSGKAFCEE